jgi:hypothetical protein
VTGVEPMLVMAGLSAASSIAGGIASNSAAKREASMMAQQSAIAMSEARRTAGQRAEDVQSFMSTQARGYSNSGVTLDGTPLLVLEETRRRGQAEVDAIMRSGRAQSSLIRQRAAQTRTSGRNALLGSFLKAGATMAGGVYKNQAVSLNPYGTTSPIAFDPSGYGGY